MDGLIGKVGVVADGLKRMSKLVITSVCGASAVQVSASRWRCTYDL